MTGSAARDPWSNPRKPAERVSGGSSGNEGVTERIRHVTIDIPAPYFKPARSRKTGKLKTIGPFINSNQRYGRHKDAEMIKTWRQTAAQRARGIPLFTRQVHILAHIYKPADAKRFDPNNLAGTTKAIVDGLVDAGLFVDDSREYVLGPDHRWGGKGNPEIIIEITEIGDNA